MQTTADGRISRAALEGSFYVDYGRRAVLAERKRRKAERRLQKKVYRERGISFAEHCRELTHKISASMGIPGELLSKDGQSNYSSNP